MAKDQPPSKYVELELRVNAHSYPDLLRYLQEFVEMIEQHYPDMNENFSGFSTGGYTYYFTFNPGMTEEKHRQALEEWVADNRKGRDGND